MVDSAIWVVRHGNTFNAHETVRRIGARTDISLSHSGIIQAVGLNMYFSEFTFTSAQCGPLLRTRQTAAVILAKKNRSAPELKINKFLQEIDYGPDENLPEDQVISRLGIEALENWEKNLIPPEGWKVNPEELTEGWRQLIKQLGAIAGNHLVVTSNGIARFAIKATGAKVDTVKIPTGGIGCIELSQGKFKSIPFWGKRPESA